MKRSDFQCLALLNSSRRTQMTAIDVYKACAAVANNGLRNKEETHLDANSRRLLDIRRGFRNGEIEKSEQDLNQLAEQDLSSLHEGDRLFLMANVHHRRGQQDLTNELMNQAAKKFAEAGDVHREVRALVNSFISRADLDVCNSADLIALEQEARRENFHDLVAAVRRTRTIELLRAGRALSALAEAQASIESYELDGCPEDKAVAIGLKAIAQLLVGQFENAQLTRSQIHRVDGKVAAYVQAFDRLVVGHAPSVAKGHPLDSIHWKTQMLKPNSIPGKLIQRLRQGPASRDELIFAIWGPEATHPSYCGRLYTAINGLRKNLGVQLIYDGESYRLP